MTYNGADTSGVFSDASSQAAVLTSLGFDYQSAPEELADEARSDASFITQENLPSALEGINTIFVVSSDDAQPLLDDPLLANQPAVAAGSVVPLGLTSFRIDYYSATDMVELLVAQYGG